MDTGQSRYRPIFSPMAMARLRCLGWWMPIAASVLFIVHCISGIAFGTRIAPLQKQLHALAEAGTRDGAFDLAAYEGLSKRWEFWGWVAILTPVAGVALMVLKPAL